jgi:hypothetical protein
MSRVRVEKIGTHFKFEIDGKVAKFDRASSDILTGDITSGSAFMGIFSSNYEVPFIKDSVRLTINFTMPWSVEAHADNPLAEIRRRVRLVQETFAKAEAEKEVWEGVVGNLPLVTDNDGEDELYDILLIDWDSRPAKVKKIVQTKLNYHNTIEWRNYYGLSSFVIVPSGLYIVGDKY